MKAVYDWNRFSNAYFRLNMLLPKQAKLRYSPSYSWDFYAVAELQGASYNIQEKLFEEYDVLEFRRSSARLKLIAEREIHDLLWISETFGYRISTCFMH